MRFPKIALTNFRSHESTTLELEPVTVIRGKNASGKSSLEQAFEISLASHAEGTTLDGKGSVGLIRLGATRADVKIHAIVGDQERMIECALKGTERKVLITKPGDEQWQGGTKSLDSFKVHKEVLSCLCNVRYFVDLDEDSQKRILASIILPKQYGWEEWVVPACNRLGLQIAWGERTPSQIIEQAYKATYDARRDINRDLKNFVMPTGDVSAAGQAGDIQARLHERQRQLEDAVKERQGLLSGHQAKQRLRMEVEGRLAAAQSRLEREESSIGSHESRLLAKDKHKELSKVAKNAAKAAALESEMMSIEATIKSKKEMQTKLNALAAEPRCPTCNQELTEDAIFAIAKPIADEIFALDTQRAQKVDERKKLGNPVDAEVAISAHDQALTDIESAKSRIAEERTAVKDAQDKLDEIGAVGEAPDTAELDARIEDLRQRVQKGNEAYSAAVLADRNVKAIEDAKAKQATLTAQQSDAEKLVAYFDTDGVKAALLRDTIGPFQATMNATLGNWGYGCTLSIEPYSFTVNGIALKHLSESERYRFAVALQVALAVASGFRFVIVDGADIFDSESFRRLMMLLSKAVEADKVLDQVIVLSTDERTEKVDKPGRIFWRFQDVSAEGSPSKTVAARL